MPLILQDLPDDHPFQFFSTEETSRIILIGPTISLNVLVTDDAVKAEDWIANMTNLYHPESQICTGLKVLGRGRSSIIAISVSEGCLLFQVSGYESLNDLPRLSAFFHHQAKFIVNGSVGVRSELRRRGLLVRQMIDLKDLIRGRSISEMAMELLNVHVLPKTPETHDWSGNRVSDWAAMKLTPGQISFAALYAHAYFVLGRRLM